VHVYINTSRLPSCYLEHDVHHVAIVTPNTTQGSGRSAAGVFGRESVQSPAFRGIRFSGQGISARQLARTSLPRRPSQAGGLRTQCFGQGMYWKSSRDVCVSSRYHRHRHETPRRPTKRTTASSTSVAMSNLYYHYCFYTLRESITTCFCPKYMCCT
jgi:hypothetical protein